MEDGRTLQHGELFEARHVCRVWDVSGKRERRARRGFSGEERQKGMQQESCTTEMCH